MTTTPAPTLDDIDAGSFILYAGQRHQVLATHDLYVTLCNGQKVGWDEVAPA